MSNVYENILNRASVRKFTDKKIDIKDLEKIVTAGIHAPSGMNRQTWKFTILTDKNNIQGFAACIRKSLGRDESYNFYNPSALIIMSNEKESPWGEIDCACALENIFLMATDLGIGSCWINQANSCYDDSLVREKLTEYDIPANHKVCGMAALGYADGEIIHKEKDMSVINFVDL